MTTTLRPSGPLQHGEGGARSRPYEVRVNSRRVGELLIRAGTAFGPQVGEIGDLVIDPPDRRRGRATVASLAAEEVLRGWGCRRVRVSVPAGSPGGLRLAEALGYTEYSRYLAKQLPSGPPALPQQLTSRPMTEEEYAAWSAVAPAGYAAELAERGMPEHDAHARAVADHAARFPEGRDTPGVTLAVLEAAGAPVGHLWLAAHGQDAYVFQVEVCEGHRGRGYGRALMLLAEREALAAGHRTVALQVFTTNTPALRLYESLGYRPTALNYAKDLL
ncbi:MULTISPECIES: GNAT family N-acetyltransferase [unclassified Streptomyces]|uniref:GNAT family N-acetyltransferase n=1 Tax=unclassified Streptomyces TaxID=2593676 RepID=UPI002E37DC3C|nr:MULTISPECIES: GNAT family N-acetyltransferase [unclassified Streptomyces]WUC67280.1 GNAT family N-acetyltransferase [Streptomyces sp. NBC_00539]